jgi:hypothetical protein
MDVQMSLFYIFYSEADVLLLDIQRLLASALHGRIVVDDMIFREGMTASVYRIEGEEDSTGKYFGFIERLEVSFNFDNSAPPRTTDHNIVLMVSSVLSILDTYPGRGVLLHNGDRAVLQRLDDGVEFDTDWEDWSTLGEIVTLASRNVLRRLPQPLQ